MSIIYPNKANLFLELSDYSVAASYCGKAVRLFRELDDQLGPADACRTLGIIFTRKGEWTTAEGLFEDSLQLNRKYDNPLAEAEALRGLGEMYAAKGDL